MDIHILDIANRACHIYAHASPRYLLVQPLGGHEQDTLLHEAEAITAKSSLPFALAAFEIADWQQELIPWNSALNSSGEVSASDTLHYIQDVLLPEMGKTFGKLPVIIGGYSLAGLFALWSAYESNSFIGVAAASPSLWIQGWPEYSETHAIHANQVYLSLGKNEEHTRNRTFAQVGERLRNEHALLTSQLGENNCILEWNDGGHFVDCDQRLANAFSWNLCKLAEINKKRYSENV